MTINPTTDGGVPGPGTMQRGSTGGIVVLVLGVLLALLGLGGIAGGIASAAILSQQGPNGYLSSPMGTFATTSYALTSPPAQIGADKLPFDPGSFRFTAESTDPEGQVFIGIGAKSEIQAYLSGVHTTEITGVELSPFRVQYRDTPGSAVPAPPTEQGFWAVSASGPGTQQITTDLRSGDWVLVVMNADAGAGVAADVQAAVNSALFGALPPGLWIGGVILLLIGAGLTVVGAVMLGKRTPAPEASALGRPAAGRNYPARLSGHLDQPLSRWLWLVKWLLAVPHFIVLFFLWFAVALTTIVSGFAILFTGRYPRPLFDFAVGVLRWSWRVSFYSYSALGTDQYPPFTLASTDYPADFHVDYPETLSHGLVLVKWWLLAIPHLLIVAIFTGTAWTSWDGGEATLRWDTNGNAAPWQANETWSWNGGGNADFSLLGLLVLIAAIILLFTGRYQRPLFDLVMGINRWVYRVAAYTLLLRDEYPPFRLDQGPLDPPEAGLREGAASAPPHEGPKPPVE